MKQTVCVARTLLAALIWFGFGACVHSQETVLSEQHQVNKPLVVVVKKSNQPIHTELIDSLLSAQEHVDSYELRILTAGIFRSQIQNNSSANSTTQNGSENFDPALIVSLGTEITDYILGLELPYPILSAAIPKLSYQQLAARRQASANNESQVPLSAIYLDQPLARSLNLIQTILPEAQRVGILLGPETKHYETDIRGEIAQRNLQLSMGQVGSEAQLIHVLDQVLDESDVFLGIVDPLVFSRTSAKNVLRTAYHWRVPLIGISPAYVRAGALASVHATPSQLGVQLAETIEAISLKGFQELPDAQHPTQFTLSVNYRVAEAMGIQVLEETLLLEQLKALEASPAEANSDD